MRNSPFSYTEKCCLDKNMVGKWYGLVFGGGINCSILTSHPTYLNLPPFSRLVFCILQKNSFRYWKMALSVRESHLSPTAFAYFWNGWHFSGTPTRASLWETITSTSKQDWAATSLGEGNGVSCGQLAWKNMETCSKGMVKRNRTSLRWLHAWPENSGLLRGVILTHLSVLVLTSSVTVLETFHTNRNSRENICSHMSQCQGMKQPPKLLREASAGKTELWRSRQHILKVATVYLEKNHLLTFRARVSPSIKQLHTYTSTRGSSKQRALAGGRYQESS